MPETCLISDALITQLKFHCVYSVLKCFPEQLLINIRRHFVWHWVTFEEEDLGLSTVGIFAARTSMLIGSTTGGVSVCEAEHCSSGKPSVLMRRSRSELMKSVSRHCVQLPLSLLQLLCYTCCSHSSGLYTGNQLVSAANLSLSVPSVSHFSSCVPSLFTALQFFRVQLVAPCLSETQQWAERLFPLSASFLCWLEHDPLIFF